MKKVYVESLVTGTDFDEFFLLKSATVRVGSNQKNYIDMILGDRTGDVSAKKWDASEAEIETVNSFETDKYVFVHGWLPDSAETFNARQKASEEDWEKARWTKWTDKYNGEKVLSDKTLICGHMPTFYANKFDDTRQKDCSDIFFGNGLVAIDAGTCNGLSHVYADRHLFDVGVEEFLWLIEHAEYVITSSFHGVAFSILFRKKFAPLINPQLPSRIENLLDILEVPSVSLDELDKATDFKYDAVFMNIERELKRSLEFLKGAIE